MAAQLWRVVNVYRVITLAYAAVLIIRDDRRLRAPGCWTRRPRRDDGLERRYYRRLPAAGRPVAVADRRRCRRGDDAGASARAGSTTPPGSMAGLADAPRRLGGGFGPGLRGGGRAVVGPGGRHRRVRGRPHRARNVADDEHLQRNRAGAHRGRRRRVGRAARAARPSRRSSGSPGARRRWPNGSGSRATFTTPCCRCWRWSAAAAGPSAARRPRSACWPGSRKRRCAPCSPRTPPGRGQPGRTVSSTCGRWWRRSAASRSRCPTPRPRCCSRRTRPRRWPARRRPRSTTCGGTPGPTRGAWLLVEDEGAHVQVSVRDNGSGFAAGRLAEAEADGRLGVPHSIVGRLRAVGGAACVTSSPGQGTEVELRVARA